MSIKAILPFVVIPLIISLPLSARAASPSPIPIINLPVGTSGAVLPLLNTPNTASAMWTFSGLGTGLAVTNNATVGGTFGVTGATTHSALVHMAQPASIQFDGSRVWSGTQGAIGNAEIYSFTNQSGSTSTSNPIAFHYFGVASDTVVASAGKAIANLRVELTTGNGFSGPRNGIQANVSINGTTPDTSGQYSAGQFAIQANAPSGSTKSTVFGSNPTAGLNSGATGTWSAVGEEVDVRAVSGTTPDMLTGLTVVLVNGHGSAGSLNLDSAFVAGNQPGVTGGWDYGIRFNGPGTLAPFKSTSTLIYTYPATGALTVTDGINISSMTFTGNSWNDGKFQFNGAGEFVASKITASGTAPGASKMKFDVVTGTAGGSCKLIAYAGTSTTPVTVVDNVGSGC